MSVHIPHIIFFMMIHLIAIIRPLCLDVHNMWPCRTWYFIETAPVDIVRLYQQIIRLSLKGHRDFEPKQRSQTSSVCVRPRPFLRQVEAIAMLVRVA
jgi:hypothetical protein